MSQPVHALNLLLALLIALAIAAVPAPAAHAATIGVDTNADELTVDGNCSLREAIRAANLNAAVDACPAGSGAAPDTITLPPGTYTLNIAGANEDAALSGDLDIIGDLTITGALSTTTIIDGGALDRVFDVISGTVLMSNVTVRNGSDGGIFNRSSGRLTVMNSAASNNVGSGISNAGALAVINGSINDNSLASFPNGNGGGIINTGTLILIASTVSGNTAPRGGGVANSGTLTVTNSIVSDNSAIVIAGIYQTGIGGGIFNTGGPASRLVVKTSSISGNQAMSDGGGIYNFTQSTITNATIANNVADSDHKNSGIGGGIYNDDNSIMSLTSSTISGNTAISGGGVIGNGLITIQSSIITSNTATYGGGMTSAGVVTITNSIISDNSAIQGGGIANAYSLAGSRLTLTGSTMSGNRASEGGGVSNFGSMLIANSALITNTATDNPGDGGGVYNIRVNDSGILTMTNTTISGNSAARDGGGLYNITGTVSLNSTTIANNTADSDINGSGDGGGIARNSGIVSFTNTLIGANADRGGQAPDCAGALVSLGYNVLQDTSGCTIGGSATGNIVGQSPRLGTLHQNGGPTLTHALLAGSPALNAANPANCPPTDQRGVARPQGPACDIGAYEAVSAPIAATTMLLISSGNPSAVGQTVTFTTTISASALNAPTGSVTFKDGTTVLGSGMLNAGGQATLSTSALEVGSHGITAAYGGDDTFSGSVSPILEQLVEVRVYLPLVARP